VSPLRTVLAALGKPHIMHLRVLVAS